MNLSLPLLNMLNTTLNRAAFKSVESFQARQQEEKKDNKQEIFLQVTTHHSMCEKKNLTGKGLFINDVITFGGMETPPSPLSSCHLSATPLPLVSVNGKKN